LSFWESSDYGLPRYDARAFILRLAGPRWQTWSGWFKPVIAFGPFAVTVRFTIAVWRTQKGQSRTYTLQANNSLHPTRRPRLGFGRAAGFFGRWIGCQRPFPAAVGYV